MVKISNSIFYIFLIYAVLADHRFKITLENTDLGTCGLNKKNRIADNLH